ncbi:MAG: crossover junction endodeoxyribonuclease RuvC [Candidatus Pacebacteria bacterium]|nr:crossover junction endodeoxyribonuclease RuvC [Candidatus Paceibacterota bacterium]
MITILAIDPGYDRLGWAVVSVDDRKLLLRAYNCIVTDRAKNLAERIQQITTELEEIIASQQPQELAIETLIFARNTTTALKVSEVRGAIIATANTHNLVIHQYNPGTIKLAIAGHGKADKRAVDKMLRLLIPDIGKVLHDDTMDAIAIAVTHALAVHHLQL